MRTGRVNGGQLQGRQLLVQTRCLNHQYKAQPRSAEAKYTSFAQ